MPDQGSTEPGRLVIEWTAQLWVASAEVVARFALMSVAP
jgi:hypothetical protein